MKKKLSIGIVAHVDAGKTTLGEALLYKFGAIRKLGRVDDKNTYLDTSDMEKERGITIFSKQARFSTDMCDITLLDTPGHIDFSPETERALKLLDYAILVISGTDGIQSHTRTIWELLAEYSIPTFIFINKMDISHKSQGELCEMLERELSPLCVYFKEGEDIHARNERLAMANDALMEKVISGENIEDDELAHLVCSRLLFPCIFGSALKLDGISFLMHTVDALTREPIYPEKYFCAKVFKISNVKDRLTFMKITGGKLCLRDEISYMSQSGEHIKEKINRIMIYSGERAVSVDEAYAGDVVAVMGLSKTYAGQGLGREPDSSKMKLSPVLSYVVVLPKDCDTVTAMSYFSKLCEEEPSLSVYYNEASGEIEVRLMGEVQTEIFKRTVKERFGLDCDLADGKILYKEKIRHKTIGVGHFEPLRHYAEVHLLLEPMPEGSGLIFDTDVPPNMLDINWQRLIMTHLREKTHRGILTNSPITDMKITLVAGKAHLKHTEGGDMREATYRALRQGLMAAGTILLEPYRKIHISIPTQYTGRISCDLEARHCDLKIQSSDSRMTYIEGKGPVSSLRGYMREFTSATHGEGRCSFTYLGYFPCHDEENVVKSIGYSPESDLTAPSCSVFCAHGAGFNVPWDKVYEFKHIDSGYAMKRSSIESMMPSYEKVVKKYHIDEKELESIMLREFGPIKRRSYKEPATVCSADSHKKYEKKEKKIIIDGYNYIHSEEELSKIAAFDLEKARTTLMDMLSNYVAYTKRDVTLVFDAYLVADNKGEEFRYNGFNVVYTKTDVTADAYIEKLMSRLGPDFDICLVTGDRLLQFSAVHSGILRMTVKEFEEDMIKISNEINDIISKLGDDI